jgi:hypothetical protein
VTGSASQQTLILESEQAIWSGSGRYKLLREFRIRMNSRKQFRPLIKTKIKADYTDV